METLEQIQARHRKEQKDLQSKITQKKKNASKKTRKGVNSECDELERQLKEKQEGELRALDGDEQETHDQELSAGSEDDVSNDEKDVSGLTIDLERSTISNPTTTPEEPRKRNRQKERLARRAAEQDALIEAAKAEASNQPDQRAVEHSKLQAAFTSHNLTEKLIRPDGHCLFSAIADQLTLKNIPLSAQSASPEDPEYKVVRRAAASYIEEHPDDFVAWLEEPLESYVSKIRDTAEWGGHLELLALARSYDVRICVVQDTGIQEIEGGGEDAEKIWLAYYKHGFGLGEHYNSLRKTA